MKKTLKKTRQILSVFFAIILMVTVMPISSGSIGAATVTDNSKIILNENGEITRAEWLYNLVIVFDMTVESGAEPDNYFSDLDGSHKYYIEMILAVEFGVVNVEAGEALRPDEVVTRDFAASTLNFCLGYQVEEGTEYSFTDYEECTSPDDAQIAIERGWFELIGGKFQPALSVTSEEVQIMLDDVDKVLNTTTIEEDYDSTYEFEDDVVVVPDGTEVDWEDGTVFITDCTQEIATGNKFAVYFNEIPSVYTAKTVIKDGDTTIIETEEVESDEAFSEIDAQGIVDAQAMQFEAAEGVEMELEEDTTQNSPYAARAIKSIGTINLKTEVSLGGGIKASVAIKIKQPKIEYSINSKHAYAMLTGETEVTCSMKESLKELCKNKEITVLNCNIGGIGAFTVALKLDLSGSISVKTKGNLTAGIECEKGGRIRILRGFEQKEYYTNIEATASVSLEIRLGITQLPVVKAYVYAEVGAESKLKQTTYTEGEPRKCTHFAAYLFFDIGATASVKFGSWKNSIDYKIQVFNEKNSPVRISHHYENGVEVSKCSRGVDYTFGKYFTKGSSRYSGSGWTESNSAYGLNADGTPFVLYNYTLDDNNATITKYNGNSNSVYIPKEIDGYTIVAIGSNAFERKSVVNVVIPDGVTSIGYEAFEDCYYLSNITIPNSVTLMGSYVFENCKVLTEVDLPDNIESISNRLFYGCTSLRSIVIPDSVTSIGDWAFDQCISLKDVTLSKNLESMGDGAFSRTAIEKIEIPKSLDWCSAEYGLYGNGYTYEDTSYMIGWGPFYRCENLKTVTFEKGTTQIAQYLFTGCTGLEEITIPDTITTIERRAFEDCLRLKKVTIGNAVTEIGDYAFDQCISLKDVTLSKSLESMGDGAFSRTAIEKIEIPKSLDWCSAEYGLYGNGYTYEDTSYMIGWGPFYRCENLKTVTFEKGTTQIAQYLFTGCTGLEEITIPDTITTIERRAFEDCLRLKKVTIGNAVTEIGDYAFDQCISLPDITIPDSVTSIGSSAFDQCVSLKDVTLSKSLESMGDGAFSQTAIEKIEIPKSLDWCNWNAGNWGSGYSYDFEGTTYYIVRGPFYRCENLKTVTFEKGTTQVAKYLFMGCTGLEEITIPDTVTTVEEGAFRDCLRLKKATIGNAVTEIGDYAFDQCISLPDITIPDSVTTIGRYAFSQCISLSKIEVPDSVISMGSSTFYGCSSLKSVKLPNKHINITEYMFRDCTSLKTIELPSTVETIQDSAFYGCTALESFTFENNKSSLKEVAQYAFYGCTSLKEANMPETLEKIGYNAFQNCISLEKVYIPQSTKTIGATAFMGCELLSDVTISDYSVTEIKTDTFKDCPGLVSIVLPKGLTTIGSQAFKNDTSLTSVTIPESVTSIDSTAFSYPTRTTILGMTGSYPETFATDEGFAFKNISVPSEGIALVDGVENIILDSGESYRAKFEWYPDNSTDVIVLTADNTKVNILGHDITARYTGDTLVTATATSGVTYEFNVHIRNASKIAVLSMPDKVSYIMGEELDLTGMAVQVTYNDGSTRKVTDYTVSGFDSSVEGENTVTVSWKSAAGSTYKTTFTVEIIDPSPKVTGIVIDTMPAKLQYERKESLDLSGMVVKASYTDGSKKEITDYTVSGYNALKNGTQNITVTYGDFTTTFTVTVGQVETTEPETTTAEQMTTEKSTTENQITTEPPTTNKQETTETESTSEEPTAIIPSTTEESTTEKQKPTTTVPTTEKQKQTTTVPITDKPTATTVQIPQPTTAVAQTTTTKISVGDTKVKSATKKKSAKKAKISLKKVKGVTGYQIKISTTKKFTKKQTITKNFNKNEFTINKLKANKKYFVKARCYKVVKGRKYYGEWTKVKQVKIK